MKCSASLDGPLSCALQEWVARFQAADLVGARVQSPEEVVQDPQMVAALVDLPASPPTNVRAPASAHSRE